MTEHENTSLSDLQQQVSELKSLLRFQAEVLDALPCTLVVIDSQLNILKTNNRVGDTSLIGQNVFTALPEFNPLKNDLSKTLQDHKKRIPELPTTDGNMVHHISMLHEKSGLEALLVMSCPASGMGQEQLNAFNREKYISLGQFSGKVAHDINNPLSVILTRMDYLQSIDLENSIEEGDVDIKEEIGIINRQAVRIYDILDKVGALQMQGKEDPVETDITDVVSRAVTIAEFQRPYKTVHAEKDIPTGFPILTCSEIKLERAIKEMVTNAFEAVGESGNVRIALTYDDPWYRVQVADDGPGIVAGNENRIFDPFYTTKTGVKGAGLGLTIAYGAALAHDGYIKVENNNGKGTSMVLMIKSL